MKDFTKKVTAWALVAAMCLNFGGIQTLAEAIPESEIWELSESVAVEETVNKTDEQLNEEFSEEFNNEESDEASNGEFVEDGSEDGREPESAVEDMDACAEESVVLESVEEVDSASGTDEGSACTSDEDTYSFRDGEFWYSVETDTEGQQYAVVMEPADPNATSLTIPVSCSEPDSDERIPVREIGASAFNGNTALTEIIIAEGSQLQVIGDEAFKNSVLTSVCIPASVQSIGQLAFFGNTNLTTLEFEEDSSLIAIGEKAFDGCTLQQLSLPASLLTIGDWAFNGNQALTTVSFAVGSQLTSIGEGAFNDTGRLTSMTAIPASVRTIGTSAFYGSGIKVLDFEPHSKLERVEQWFCENAAIEKVTIPASVTSMAGSAFWHAVNLKEVDFEAGSHLETISASAFLGTKLTSVTIPSSVKAIEDSAFRDISVLTSLEFEEGSALESIGENAFKGNGLTSLDLPASLTTIGEYAFFGCGSLASVTLGQGSRMKTIGSHAFQGTALTSLDLPASLTTIGEYAFYECKLLTSVTIEKGSHLETISGHAFQYTGMPSIDLPASLTTIGEYAFFGCGSLASVTIEEGTCISAIGESAFYDTAITELSLPTLSDITLGAAFVCDADRVTIICPVGAAIIPTLVMMKIPYRTVGRTASVTVLDENGNSLDAGFSVAWYKNQSVSAVGTGTRLYLAEGTQPSDYSFRISLGEELAEKYYTPDKVSLAEEQTDVSVTLEPIGTVTVSGRLVGESGEIPADAVMTATSVYDNETRKPREVILNQDGSFSAEIPNITTLLEISADGYYSRKNYIISGRSGEMELNLGTMTLYPLPEAKIRLSVTKVSAVREDSPQEPEQASVSVLDGYTFTLADSQGNLLEDFSREGSSLYLGEGFAGYYGQTLTLHTTYQDNSISIADVEVTLDENGVGDARVTVLENGGLAIDSVSGAVPARILVFDAGGNRISSALTSSSWKSESLPDGEYQVILLQKQDYFDDFQSIRLLDELGLKAGTDYVSENCTVSGGIITVLENVEVPEFDSSRFDYIEDEETYVRVNKSTVTVGNIVSLRIAYKLKPEAAPGLSERKLVIPLPENLVYLPGSATLDGKVSDQIVYDAENSTLTIPVEADEALFRCMLMPVESGSYTIAPYLAFEQAVSSGTVSGVQPLGRAGLTSPKLDFTLPATTSKTTVQVGGTALTGSTVVLYEGNTEVGRTSARSGGTWNASIELQNAKRSGPHYIHAVIYDNVYGYTYSTDAHRIAYHTSYVEVDHVIMKNFGHREITTTWTFDGSGLVSSDESDSSSSWSSILDAIKNMPPAGGSHQDSGGMVDRGQQQAILAGAEKKAETHSYDFNPLYPEFTFQVFFDTEDVAALAEKNPEVYVKTVGVAGDYEWVTAYYDSKTGTWIGSADLDFYTIPYTIEVSYDQPDIGEDAPVLDLDRVRETAGQLDGYGAAIAESFEEYYEMGETIETDDSVTIEFLPLTDELIPFDMKISYTDAVGIEDSDYTTYSTLDGKELKMRMEDGAQDHIGYSILAEDKVLTISLGFGGFDNQTAAYAASSGPTMEGFWDDLAEIASRIDPFNVSDMLQLRNRAEILVSQTITDYDILESMIDDAEYQLMNAAMCGGQLRLSAQDRADLLGKIYSLRSGLQNDYENIRAEIVTYYMTGEMYFGASSVYSIHTAATSGVLKKLASDWTNKEYWKKLLGTDLTSQEKMIREAATNIASFGIEGLGEWINFKMQSIYSQLNSQISALYKDITSRYKSCEAGACPCGESCQCKKPDPPKDDKKPSDPKEPEADPSGYVYEAVPSNRLSGVVASILKRVEDTDASGEVTGEHWDLWNAEDYGQIQNQVTGVDGTYGWDVTFGEWRVLYMKDGYETYVSEIMDVPPEWTDVNIGMISTLAPELAGVLAYTDSIDLAFSQYMDIATVTDETVGISTDSGPLSGVLTPVNAEYNAEGSTQYATIFRFTPNDALARGTSVTVNVSGAVSYNGKGIRQASQSAAAKQRISEIIPVEVPEVFSAKAGLLTFNLGVEGAGQTVTVTNLTPSLISIDSETVTADENGMITIRVEGLMTGNAVIQLSMEDYGLKLEQKVNIRHCSHSWDDGVVSKAPSGGTGGEITYTCTSCGEMKTEEFDGSERDLAGGEMVLQQTAYTYDGREHTPGVTVTLAGTTVNPAEYTVTYTGNINAGTASVTVSAKEGGRYYGSCSKAFTIQKAANRITASNFTRSAHASKAQSFSIGAGASGGALTYTSDTSAVTVSGNGTVTISANYAGTAVITITAGNSNYQTVEKKITVAVGQIADTITASDSVKTASAKSQSFSIGAKHSGKGALTYSSNNKSVKISGSGVVTIAKNYVGNAAITITAATSGIYKSARKTIMVTVNPPKTSFKSVKSKKSKTVSLSWKKSSMATGYQIQYSTSKSFASGNKVVTVKNKKTVSKTLKKLKGRKTYYFRIRTYKTVSGVKYYSDWSSAKKVKVKK